MQRSILKLWPAVLFVAGLAYVLLRAGPLGIPSEMEYHHVPEPNWDLPSLLAALLPAIGVVVVVGMVLRKEEEPSRGETSSCVIVLTLCSFLFHVACSLLLSSYGVAQALYHVVQMYGDGSYLLRATQIGSLSQYLAGLEAELAAADVKLFPHPSVHPPGFPVFFYCLYAFAASGAPGMDGTVSWLWEHSPILKEMFVSPGMAPDLIAPYTAAAGMAAVAFWGSAGLLPVPTYLLARLFLSRRQSLLAAGASALLPGTHLFSPSTDQFLPLAGTVLIYLGVAAAQKRKLSLALAFGVAIGITINLTLAMSVCVSVVFLYGLLHERDLRQLRIPVEKPPIPSASALALRAGTGLAVVVLLLYTLFHMNLVNVLKLCLDNNRTFNLTVNRSYLPCLALQPFETAYSLGIPLFCLLLWSAATRALALRRGVPLRASSFLWAAVGTVIILGVTGVNRGEVGRLWLFLYPSLTVAALVGMARDEGQEPEGPAHDLRSPFGVQGLSSLWLWMILLAGQVIQTVLMCLHVDAMMSARALSGG